MVCGFQLCEGVSSYHFWIICHELDNLHILSQILSATLKTDVIKSILGDAATVSEVKKLAQGHARKVQDQRKARIVLFPMPPSQRGRHFILIIK